MSFKRMGWLSSLIVCGLILLVPQLQAGQKDRWKQRFVIDDNTMYSSRTSNSSFNDGRSCTGTKIYLNKDLDNKSPFATGADQVEFILKEHRHTESTSFKCLNYGFTSSVRKQTMNAGDLRFTCSHGDFITQSSCSYVGPRACSVANGQGTQQYNAQTESYGSCVATACNGGFILAGNTCIPFFFGGGDSSGGGDGDGDGDGDGAAF